MSSPKPSMAALDKLIDSFSGKIEALKKEQETELRIKAVENSMSEIKNMVQMLTKKLL